MDIERLCLIDIDPPDQGRIQRRVMEIEVEGELIWREFDIVTVFENESDARRYAQLNPQTEIRF